MAELNHSFRANFWRVAHNLKSELIAEAVERVSQDSHYFELQIRESVAQANGSDAHWLTHDEVMSEWASERAALLSGKPSPATTP